MAWRSSYQCAAEIEYEEINAMILTYEAVIDEHGVLRLLDPVKFPPSRRVLITILDEEPELNALESAMLSEPAKAVEWLAPEEDAAWSHLDQLPSL
jgi:hypothetical protein